MITEDWEIDMWVYKFLVLSLLTLYMGTCVCMHRLVCVDLLHTEHNSSKHFLILFPGDLCLGHLVVHVNDFLCICPRVCSRFIAMCSKDSSFLKCLL